MSYRAARGIVQTALILALPAGAAAGPVDGGPVEPSTLVWQCAQEFDEIFHVLCAPRRPENDSGTPVPSAEPATATAAGTQALHRLPVAQRGDPEVFSARAWRVPLHSQPTDQQMVRALLNSVLCGTHPACSVQYAMPAPRLAAR